MSGRIVAFGIALAALAACSDGAHSPEPGNDFVREWGNKPVSELDGIPAYARVCFGSHYALLTEQERGEPDDGLPADMQMVCARAVPELEGPCRTYAREATRFAEVAGKAAQDSAEWTDAERRANAAFGECAGGN